MDRVLSKPRIDLNEANLIWMPHIYWGKIYYEDDTNEVYNVLYDRDHGQELIKAANNPNGSKMNGMLNAPGSVLKKRRRRWYKAYNTQRRRRKSKLPKPKEDSSGKGEPNADDDEVQLIKDGDDDLSQFVSQEEDGEESLGSEDSDDPDDADEDQYEDEYESEITCRPNGLIVKDEPVDSDYEFDSQLVKRAQKRLDFSSSNENSCDSTSLRNHLHRQPRTPTAEVIPQGPLNQASGQEPSKLRIRIKPVPVPIPLGENSALSSKRRRPSSRNCTSSTVPSKRRKKETTEFSGLLNGDSKPKKATNGVMNGDGKLDEADLLSDDSMDPDDNISSLTRNEKSPNGNFDAAYDSDENTRDHGRPKSGSLSKAATSTPASSCSDDGSTGASSGASESLLEDTHPHNGHSHHSHRTLLTNGVTD